MLEDVTVCVCTYNEENNIKRCIQNIKKMVLVTFLLLMQVQIGQKQ